LQSPERRRIGNAYHGALGFFNTYVDGHCFVVVGRELTITSRSKLSWNVNFEAWPSFLGALTPHIHKYANGSVDLVWENHGGVFIYNDINVTFWNAIHELVATMNGNQFNTLLNSFIAMNTTLPFYNPISVYKSFPNELLLEGLECFQWTFMCLSEIQRIGGKLGKGITYLKQSLPVIYAKSTPKKVNISNPEVLSDVILFYEAILHGWKDVGVSKFFKELWRIAAEGTFYIYDNTDYYVIELSYPYFEMH